MSDEYRFLAGRISSFQALAEFIGVLPFAEWVPKVPDFTRKQMLVAKIQDEVGHGHVTIRVAEDLGQSNREKVLWDFVEGKTKLLNIFHYGFDSWEEIGPAALLQNSAAMTQFQSLANGTYLPYSRALKKIEVEESFHYHHAWDLTHEVLTTGTPTQRDLVQQAFETWLIRALGYFGPPDLNSVETNPSYMAGLKVDANDVIRQRWLSKIIPVFQKLGVEIRSELVRFDQETQRWIYADIDWSALKTMLTEGGPRYDHWRTQIRESLTKNGPYLRTLMECAA